MAKTYAQLNEEIETLKAEAEAVRKQEVADVVARIKDAVAFYGLTAADLGLGGKTRGRKPMASTAAVKQRPGAKPSSQAKYLDGTGNVWGGRGPRPAWLKAALAAGRSLESLAAGASGATSTAQ